MVFKTSQAAGKPRELDAALSFALQTAARLDSIEVAVDETLTTQPGDTRRGDDAVNQIPPIHAMRPASRGMFGLRLVRNLRMDVKRCTV